MRLIFLLILASCTHGGLRVENDIFAQGIKNKDRYFTHGTKFFYRGKEATYGINQNLYTPSKKSADATEEELKDNRPYTGFLNAEYREHEIKDSDISIRGIQIGCVGRCSMAKETQQGVHKLLDQSIPDWTKEYSLKSEPALVISKEKYYGIIDNSRSYSSLFNRVRMGTLINSISGGFNYKFGTGVEKLNTEVITFKIPKEEFSYYFFTEVEGRYVLYNALLEGSMFQDERHTVDANPFVFQADAGIVFKYKQYKFNYSYTFITDEWDGQEGVFAFGGISLEW